MKTVNPVTLFIGLIILFSSCSQNTLPELPEKLSSLDVGLKVKHSAKRVYATVNEQYPNRGLKYKWVHATTVSSTKGNVTITEFGAFTKENGKWVESTIYNRPFNAREFDDWYDCPNALLISKKSYSDNNNWTSANRIEKSSTPWYYIGINDAKEEVVGYSKVKLIGEMKK